MVFKIHNNKIVNYHLENYNTYSTLYNIEYRIDKIYDIKINIIYQLDYMYIIYV